VTRLYEAEAYGSRVVRDGIFDDFEEFLRLVILDRVDGASPNARAYDLFACPVKSFADAHARTSSKDGSEARSSADLWVQAMGNRYAKTRRTRVINLGLDAETLCQEHESLIGNLSLFATYVARDRSTLVGEAHVELEFGALRGVIDLVLEDQTLCLVRFASRATFDMNWLYEAFLLSSMYEASFGSRGFLTRCMVFNPLEGVVHDFEVVRDAALFKVLSSASG
jgi:hypothetical protein